MLSPQTYWVPLDKHAAHTFSKPRKSHPTNRDIFKFKQRVKVKNCSVKKDHFIQLNIK